MCDNNDEVSLTKVSIVQSSTAEQNKLIGLLMQQITELAAEVQKDHDTPNSVIIVDIPNNGRPTLFSIPLNSSTEDFINPPSNPIQSPSTID
ncbi:hypothetical protein EJD97_002230 [Solanum chilense]|uniref:Uncharacterized protein n=1 Tax=Solanum chilense TaxID=4083 RepID=A0A6N2C3R7_SOLCI|nr:hypothetical protein EJD97_002230 [Solanum chilense]